MIQQKLLVLAGGFGTRLRDVVSDVPKPLAPVHNTPFILFLLEEWYSDGVREFIFLLHYEADLIVKYIQEIQEQYLPESTIKFIVEPEPMGTGGAIAFAVSQLGLKNDFIVANADTYLSNGIKDLILSPCPALGCVKVPDTSRYGKVEIDNGSVVAFNEKCPQSGEGWINAGVAKLESSMFEGWDGKAFSLESEIFPLLASKKRLSAVKLDADFIDIGVPEDYLKFCHFIQSKGIYS